MKLPIDTAYFARIPIYNARAVTGDFVEFCKMINDNLSERKGIDICLRHHFFKETLCASALFINHVPHFMVTKSILLDIRKILKSNILECEQVISLGETTVRGGGGISLFDGIHVEHFRDTLSMVKRPLTILTGVLQIDQYLRSILINLAKYNTDALICENFLNTLTNTVKVVREWLSEADREQYGLWFKIKSTDGLKQALDSLWRVFDAKMSVRNNLDEMNAKKTDVMAALRFAKGDYLHIREMRQTDATREDFLPAKGHFSVSDRLRRYNEQNLKQLAQIKGADLFSIVMAAVPAVVFKALGDLAFVDLLPLFIVAVAVLLNFFSIIILLLSYIKPEISAKLLWKTFKELIDIQTPNTEVSHPQPPEESDIKPSVDLGDFREQHELFVKYGANYGVTGVATIFAKTVNNYASASEQVELGPLDYLEASAVINNANLLFWRGKKAKTGLILFGLAMSFYAVAALVYGIAWLQDKGIALPGLIFEVVRNMFS